MSASSIATPAASIPVPQRRAAGQRQRSIPALPPGCRAARARRAPAAPAAEVAAAGSGWRSSRAGDGWAGRSGSASCPGDGSSRVFRKALAPFAFSASAPSMTPDFVAAAIARERQALDQFAHLVDLDLLGVLLQPHDVRIRDDCPTRSTRTTRRHRTGAVRADSHSASAASQFASCSAPRPGALSTSSECGSRPARCASRRRMLRIGAATAARRRSGNP